MLEQLKYVNHQNEVFAFGKDGIFVDMNELHDYEWTVTKKNERITSLDRSVSKRKLPVTIICDTEAKGIEARNKLLEIAEKDVLALQHGKIIIGDYYFKCFVTKSQKKDYLLTKRHMKATLTLTSDFPYWVKEATMVFRKASEQIGGDGEFLDFAFDYPMDFTSSITGQKLKNTSFVPSNFKLIIYGECANPVVYVGDHAYQVNCTVGSGEYLMVDSVTKKITLVGSDGKTTNKFNDRNRDSYIFEKIPAGESQVSWDGEFGFDIIILEERSEPKWT